MNHISEKELKAIAKKYSRDAQELRDYVLDMESTASEWMQNTLRTWLLTATCKNSGAALRG